ncbi:hypothetical protein EIP91_001829 [Steccherinum ochraceum]|uniref:Uncharacterized protein n=1 Tax=Steccherinum ochraceum TaxID=92696 RepID=A0A4R0RDC1_9APHY|nr:hypothetical protein EIP91_001829 [Steccherinum ochraceum]
MRRVGSLSGPYPDISLTAAFTERDTFVDEEGTVSTVIAEITLVYGSRLCVMGSSPRRKRTSKSFGLTAHRASIVRLRRTRARIDRLTILLNSSSWPISSVPGWRTSYGLRTRNLRKVPWRLCLFTEADCHFWTPISLFGAVPSIAV